MLSKALSRTFLYSKTGKWMEIIFSSHTQMDLKRKIKTWIILGMEYREIIIEEDNAFLSSFSFLRRWRLPFVVLGCDILSFLRVVGVSLSWELGEDIEGVVPLWQPPRTYNPVALAPVPFNPSAASRWQAYIAYAPLGWIQTTREVCNTSEVSWSAY